MGIPDEKTHASTAAVVAGARFGSYVIVDALGAGGMGQVYRASEVFDLKPTSERPQRFVKFGSGKHPGTA